MSGVTNTNNPAELSATDRETLKRNETEFKNLVATFRLFHTTEKADALTWHYITRRRAWTDISNAFSKSGLQFDNVREAVINACNWKTFINDMKEFAIKDKVGEFKDKYNKRGKDTRNERGYNLMRDKNCDVRERERNRNKEETENKNTNGHGNDGAPDLDTLPHHRKIGGTNALPSTQNNDPNNRYGNDEIERLYNTPNDTSDPSLQIKEAINAHNAKVYFKHSKIAHVDYICYVMQYLIRKLGANGIRLKRHITIACNAEKYDPKLLSSMDRLNMSYTPLGAIFLRAVYKYIFDHANSNVQPLIKTEYNKWCGLFIDCLAEGVTPSALNDEIASVLNDPQIDFHTVFTQLTDRLQIAKQSSTCLVDSSYVSYQRVQCQAEWIFGYCAQYQKDPKLCPKFHGCVLKECANNPNHWARYCPQSPQFFQNKYNKLQRSYGRNNGGNRGGYNNSRGRGYNNSRGRGGYNNSRGQYGHH
eukprot:250748_1